MYIYVYVSTHTKTSIAFSQGIYIYMCNYNQVCDIYMYMHALYMYNVLCPLLACCEFKCISSPPSRRHSDNHRHPPHPAHGPSNAGLGPGLGPSIAGLVPHSSGQKGGDAHTAQLNEWSKLLFKCIRPIGEPSLTTCVSSCLQRLRSQCNQYLCTNKQSKAKIYTQSS